MVDFVAGRITDADEIRSSGQFPYQFLAAFLNADDSVPKIRLHSAKLPRSLAAMCRRCRDRW
jgi:60 kDa SS-A/Ro ribonucleoprotein